MKKPNRRRVALIAHDNLKGTMVDWARAHLAALKEMDLYATGTTGTRVASELPLRIRKFKSGPLGGDQQIGAKIAEGKMDLVVFFWDPLAPHSHDVDVKALLRIAAVYDVPMACNRATADLIMSAIA
jgi:methylglyoxal synthase